MTLRLLLVTCAALLASCRQIPDVPLVSPTAEFSAKAEISGSEAGPTRQCCVKLVVQEAASGRKTVFQTGASDVQAWALAWSSPTTLVLYSSDLGTNAYDIKPGKITERSADASEEAIATRAYKAKYPPVP